MGGGERERGRFDCGYCGGLGWGQGRALGAIRYFFAHHIWQFIRMRLEDMRMFQASEALIREVELLLPRAWEKKPKAADHLERSLESEHTNICEGIGLFRPAGKRAAYEIARKEANEVRGTLRRLVLANVFTQQQIQKAYDLVGSIVGMLTASIKVQERRLAQEEAAEEERKLRRRK